MRLLPSKLWTIRAAVAGAVFVTVASFASCSAKGPPRPSCAELRDGGVTDSGLLTLYTMDGPTTDAAPSQTFGMAADPGPQCLDCTQGAGLEIMTIANYEDGFAPAWFNYGEPGVPIAPLPAGPATNWQGVPVNLQGAPAVDGEGRVDASALVRPGPPYWGLQVANAEALPGGPRCGSRHALHLMGGPFGSWGGGYVTRYFTVRGQDSQGQTFAQQMCPPGIVAGPDTTGVGLPPVLSVDSASCGFWATPVAGQASFAGIDVSAFEGVSFWARRGPGGAAHLRISLIDDNTSEGKATADELAATDAGIEANPSCRRTRGCCRGCRELTREYLKDAGPGGTAPFIVETITDRRCHLEGECEMKFRRNDAGEVTSAVDCASDPTGNSYSTAVQQVWTNWNDNFTACCPTPSEDPRYGGKDCNPYVFTTDYSSGYFCWNPGDPPLPEVNENRCEDGFQASVVVDTEWKLFTIPWRELRRFTPNKAPVDPTGIWQIAFYFGSGYLDTYVDDVGFYRKRP